MDKKIAWQTGRSSPLGVSQHPEGFNFAIYSEEAEKVLLLFFIPGEEESLLEIPLAKQADQIWHVLVTNLPSHVEYGYKVQKKGHWSPLLLDPYAKSFNLSSKWRAKWKSIRARALTSLPFDWQGDQHPRIPSEELIIYEMHVRGFTVDRSSNTQSPGTFRAVIEKIPHFIKLGINAIELMPVHLFNENDNPHKNPVTGEPLVNFWGYAPLSYFALMNRYAHQESWGEEIQEFKEMVRALHQAGIEVILDVVYNHTGENAEQIVSYRGFDDKTYYMHSTDGKPLDFTGCHNTFNCNHPIVANLILDSLRYLVSELHVDGFRFDLASIFSRDQTGKVVENPPIVLAILNDPILKNTRLIAEAWDAAGLYQVGSFPGFYRFSEWNGRYRDVVRRFIKGTDGQAGDFATALCGSEDLFNEATPCHSINFITAHDGFTLRDLVSYQKKHNLENGEQGNDGASDNESWNCGVEGLAHDPEIEALRQRQMRNFVLALFVSLGTPMFLMGDEYGHTKGGNNNTYCQDDEKNYFLWDHLEKNADFYRFVQQVIHLRKTLPHFKRTSFLGKEDVLWHGHSLNQPDWGTTSRFVAYQLKHRAGDLYIAFNAHYTPAKVQLPQGNWRCLAHTALDSSGDFESTLQLPPYSAAILAENRAT